MARLVDVDAFRDFWNKNYRHQYANDNFLFALANFHTVDAVEVVRCRDFKHLVLTAEGEHNPFDCVCDYWMTDGLNDNDFCSYGERKDGDGNG